MDDQTARLMAIANLKVEIDNFLNVQQYPVESIWRQRFDALKDAFVLAGQSIKGMKFIPLMQPEPKPEPPKPRVVENPVDQDLPGFDDIINAVMKE